MLQFLVVTGKAYLQITAGIDFFTCTFFSFFSLQYPLMSCLIITILDGHLNDHIVWSQFITIVWLLDHVDFCGDWDDQDEDFPFHS